MRTIGIMQGRLSPARKRLQSFPEETWESEFALAARLGFDALEWVLESERVEANPLLTGSGRKRIRELVAESGVEVVTVCANHFMDHRLSVADENERRENVATLRRWLPMAAEAGVKIFMLPVLERADVPTASEREILLSSLRDPLNDARRLGLRIALETERPAGEFAELLDSAGDPELGACYDCGNAAARGWDPVSDLATLGSRIFYIHIKDRPVGGGNVPLGSGAVDFPAFLSAVAGSEIGGPLVLETTPGDDPVSFAERHLRFVRDLLPAA